MAFTQITANELQALIGRELTDQEFENFDTLIQVAEKQVEGYLCATLEELFPSTDEGDGEIPADLKFVIGNFFKAISVRNHYDPTVSSKKVEVRVLSGEMPIAFIAITTNSLRDTVSLGLK